MRLKLKWLWATRRRRWLLLVAAILLIVMPVASVELTSQSWFCNSCHIMNSYYDSWKTGTHKDIQCVQCHIPPGMNNFLSAKLNGLGQVVDDMLERTSTKPSASISDFACTRAGCHDLSRVQSLVSRGTKYFFDHRKHINLEYLGIELHCTTCHSHVNGQKHFEVNSSVCVTCHLVTPGASVAPVPVVSTEAQPANGNHLASDVVIGGASTTNPATTSQPVVGATLPLTNPEELWTTIKAAVPQSKQPPRACKNCHEAPRRTIEYRGLKVVHEDYLSYGAACESCHRGVTSRPEKMDEDHCFSCHEFGMEKMTSVVDMHRVHSSGRHKVECFSCHGVIRHGPQAQFMQFAQMECQSCHQGQHTIQQKTYKSGQMVAHQPVDGSALSPMFLAHVACTACHTESRPVRLKTDSGAMVAAASPKSCDNCHKPGLGQQLVPMWQKNTRNLYDAVVKMLPGEGSGLSKQQQQSVTEARNLLELVRLDGSWGAHNPRYTQKLLEEAQQKLVGIRAAGSQPPGTKQAVKTASEPQARN